MTAPGITAAALRVAAARGRLKAARGPDGDWRSTSQWVEEYVASKGKPPLERMKRADPPPSLRPRRSESPPVSYTGEQPGLFDENESG